MDINTLRSISTVAALVAFLGIVWWAWSKSRKSDFEQAANRYLKLLQIDHKVTVQAGKFSTTDLSQGQRKRLALVVAYLEDRPIYIFDEWAADQDPDYKRVFYSELLPDLKARGKAVVVVTHDDRYFHLGDRVLVLEDGRARPRAVAAPAIAVQT